MRIDKKIYQIKIKLKELKSGGHVSPESLQRFVPLKELKKLIKCWYDEKPLYQIAIPEAILKYDELTDSAHSLALEMDRTDDIAVYEEIYNEYDLIWNSAFQLLLKEKEKDPSLILWLDYDVPVNFETSDCVPLPIGSYCRISPRIGYGFCPSSATLATKILALEETLNNVCESYESKALEPFFV
jgi:hypothetical protein